MTLQNENYIRYLEVGSKSLGQACETLSSFCHQHYIGILNNTKINIDLQACNKSYGL